MKKKKNEVNLVNVLNSRNVLVAGSSSINMTLTVSLQIICQLSLLLSSFFFPGGEF